MRVRNPFKRSLRVPDEVVAQADLRPGERVLAGTPAAGDQWLLGTRDALIVVGPGSSTRIAWEKVERADWKRDDERFLVSEVGEFGQPRPRLVFIVPEPGLLLELVRERVTASVVLQRRVSVVGGRGVVVIARRPPTGGGIIWAYEFDEGVDPGDPAVMDVAEAGLLAAQRDLGG